MDRQQGLVFSKTIVLTGPINLTYLICVLPQIM